MPSAASFGAAFALVRGSKIAEGFSIVKRSIGHEAVKPNRVYRYPIQLTIATTAGAKSLGKRKRIEPNDSKTSSAVEPDSKTLNAVTEKGVSDSGASGAGESAKIGSSVTEKMVREWFGGAVAGEDKKRLVWTFYGNPYDIWVEGAFKVQTNALGKIVLTALGHGIRSFTAPKKPPTLQPKDPTKLPLVQPVSVDKKINP